MNNPKKLLSIEFIIQFLFVFFLISILLIFLKACQKPNTPPIAAFSINPEYGDIDMVFTFSATESYDIEDESTILQVHWDWDGDGIWDTDLSTNKVIQHQYSKRGNYSTILEVKDSEGLFNSSQKLIIVKRYPPIVLTDSIINAIDFTAQSGGDVIYEGGSKVTAKGVCWSVEENPDLEDRHTNDGNGYGEFTSILTDLSQNTAYYIRAYATNNIGTSYGKQVYFTTESTFLWQKCLGGSGNETAQSIKQTNDGGYVVAGSTDSNDGDITGNHGRQDIWIVKMDETGIIQWQKCLGGSGFETAQSIQQTNDGGYIIAGSTDSNDGDVTGNHGSSDFWIVKLNEAGTIQWQKCLGGSGSDYSKSIQQTNDGGYIVAGYTKSNDGDVTGNHGGSDIWIVKLNEAGTIQWQKCLGGSFYEYVSSIQQTTDGGYILAGETMSKDGDVIGYYEGFSDGWIVKLDYLGDIQWQKCIGGSRDDNANSIWHTNDGGYIIGGETNSNDGELSGYHGEEYYGLHDIWILKLDSYGIIQWQKCLGGTGLDKANSIQQISDGSYIVAGFTESNNGDVTGNHGGSDFWIIKFDETGNVQWQKCFGGSLLDCPHSIQQSSDGGYIIGGETNSNDGDVSGNHGLLDYWIIKVNY